MKIRQIKASVPTRDGTSALKQSALAAGVVILGTVFIAFTFVYGLAYTSAHSAPAEYVPSQLIAPSDPEHVFEDGGTAADNDARFTGSPQSTATCAPPSLTQVPAETLPPEVSGTAKKDYVPVDSAAAAALDSSVNSASALLFSRTSGKIAAQYAADKRIYPASLTKIMTLIIAAENVADFTDTFTLTREIIYNVNNRNGSNVGLAIGEKVTLRDLMYATALPSACDAAAALACYVAGSEASFCELMNEKAKELGMSGTNFANSSGLPDDDNYSTARDVATMLNYALDNELLREIICSQSYVMSKTDYHAPRTVRSTTFSWLDGYTGNRTPNGFSILGGKTGSLTSSGRSMASVAVDASGEEYILVAVGAPSCRALIDDVYGIFSLGFT